MIVFSAQTTSWTRNRLAQLQRENAEMREIATTSATREALLKLEAENRTLKIRDRHINITSIINQFKRAQRVDLCFLVDSTGSMSSCIHEVKSKINDIVKQVTRVYPDLKVRLSFVGYRDHGDGGLRFSILGFGECITSFERFVGGVSATGGDDTCEDVFGGIYEAIKLGWQHETRLIIHFADAPCHGNEFHDGCSDNYPGGDPHGLQIHSLLGSMQLKGIQYYFVHLNSTTRKMIQVFKCKTTMQINELDMSDGFDSMVEAMTETVCQSIMTVDKAMGPKSGRHVVFSNLSSISEASTILDYTIDPSYPTTFRSLEAVVYKFGAFNNDSDLHRAFSLTSDRTVNIKFADRPFAEGASRICYYGKDNFGRKVVLKEFKDTMKNTFDHYKALVETSVVACYLADEFNTHVYGFGSNVSFILPLLLEIKDPLKTPSKSTSFLCYEPQIEGEYKKFNNNYGYVSGKNYNEILNAFSHWTYKYTKGYMMVVDLQGVISGSKFILTDPAIHCEEDRGEALGLLRFGNTNLGKKGMKQFLRTHSCNSVCFSLGLNR